MKTPHVLYEDNHLLVIDKPCGLATAGVTGVPSVYTWAQQYIKTKYQKPGNVYVGIVSRLDTVTSGVLPLARTSKAAARLTEQLRLRQIDKTYVAILEGHLRLPGPSTWTDQIFKDDQAHRMRVVAENRQAKSALPEKTQEAKLIIQPLRLLSVNRCDATLVTIKLITGRKHQIRLQCSSRGHAVWGDRKYGAKTNELPAIKAQDTEGFSLAIALHAKSLQMTHPTLKTNLTFNSPLPSNWQLFGTLPLSEIDSDESAIDG